jgi:radical SAM protein with 4Fe4S-binding SPASM domain
MKYFILDNHVIYFPLVRKALRVKPEFIKLIETEEARLLLQKKGLLEEPQPRITEFKPTNVNFVPSFDCNSRCIYCYSDAGKSQEKLEEKVISPAIKYVLNNANDFFKVGFSGGGEPTTNWSFVQNAVKTAKELGEEKQIKPLFSINTNGLVNEQQLEFILKNFNFVNISMDGMEEIHNYQRPAAGNAFERVFRTVQALDDSEVHYVINCVLTKKSLPRINEIMDFFTQFERCKVTLLPATKSGRCNSEIEVDYMDLPVLSHPQYFANSFADRIHSHHDTSCRALRDNFIVVPGGLLTACLRVTKPDEFGSEVFMYGIIDDQVYIDEDRINYLLRRTGESIKGCDSCIGQYSCAGDCAYETLKHTGDIYVADPESQRCVFHRRLIEERILESLG